MGIKHYPVMLLLRVTRGLSPHVVHPTATNWDLNCIIFHDCELDHTTSGYGWRHQAGLDALCTHGRLLLAFRNPLSNDYDSYSAIPARAPRGAARGSRKGRKEWSRTQAHDCSCELELTVDLCVCYFFISGDTALPSLQETCGDKTQTRHRDVGKTCLCTGSNSTDQRPRRCR